MVSGVTISGAVSGLDTAGIIDQLVAVQRNQQTILSTQQSAVQKRADAYASLTTSLSSLGTLVTDLAKTSAWTGSTATSSSSSVTASATGTTSAGITFDVKTLARAHSLISVGSASSTDAVVAAGGTLTLTRHDGTTAGIDVGGGSLSEVVSAINGSGNGLYAAAVKTTEGYRLQVTSATTGEESSFSLSGFTGFTSDTLADLTVGTDAKILVGDPESTEFYYATSSTNTFGDLVPGLSFTVSKVEDDVTVTSKIDGSTVADKITSMVSSANSILADIASKSSYDLKTKTGGVFSGQSVVRTLQQNILTTVSGSGAPGVHLSRDGKLTFDREEFLTAFTADPAAVAKKFGSDSTFTGGAGVTDTSVTVTNALKTSRAGTYDVTVTQAATAEKWKVTPVLGNTVVLERGDSSITYTLAAADLNVAATDLGALLSAEGLGITVSVDGSDLVFTADGVGSGSAFTTTLNGAAGTLVTAGADIAGTIDGLAGTGLGTILSLPSGASGAAGLSLNISTTAADLTASGGAIGSVTYSPGLAQRLATLVNDATASSTGALTTAKDTANSEVKRFQTAIDAWDARLTSYRQSLTTQFTAMETALAKLKSTTSALSGLITNQSDDG
jgi:flagellar hook-associated protein 2